MPFVSVIVATYNRARFLPHLLQALGRQDYPSDRMEVLIVDESSVDDSEHVVTSCSNAVAFPVKFLTKPREGPGPARAFGVRHARGDVLAFTDSDCVPDPGWLSSAVRSLDPQVGLVTGTIELDRTPDTHFFFNAQLDEHSADRGLYRTANLVVPREVYEAVGGFDARFAYSGEDTDLGWRIRRTGRRAAFIHDVKVIHLATPVSIVGWLLKPLELKVIPRLVAMYPEIRMTALWARYFMSPRHFIFDVAVAGVVLSVVTRAWPWLLLVVPWFVASAEIWFTMAQLGRLHKAAAIQLLLIERYGLGLAVLIWSSLKYRRLVL